MDVFFKGEDLLQISVLWKEVYHVMVGETDCQDVKVEESQITCLPPAREPDDLGSDNVRVRVSVIDHFYIFCS